jgi:hypothetical protein
METHAFRLDAADDPRVRTAAVILGIGRFDGRTRSARVKKAVKKGNSRKKVERDLSRLAIGLAPPLEHGSPPQQVTSPWRELPGGEIEFTMKRLRSAD